MPAKSQQQQKFMGLVHAYKKGEVPASKVSKAVKDAAKSMSKKSVKKYAQTDHDDLPKKVTEEKIKAENLVIEFGKSFQKFTRAVHMLGKGITKMKGDKTDERIIQKAFKKQIIPFGRLIDEWNKGQQKNPGLTTESKACLCEACQKGYKTHPKRKTKIMFGKRYRNCVKAEAISDKMSVIMTKLAKSLGIKSVVDMATGSGSLSYFLDDKMEAKKLATMLKKTFKRVRLIPLDKSKGDSANFVVAADMLGLESKDHEGSMAKSQLERSKEYAEMIYKIIQNVDKNKDGEVEFPAWVQSKLTKSMDYLQSVYNYLDGKDGLDDKFQDEASTSSNLPGYKTPQAFAKSTKSAIDWDDEDDDDEILGGILDKRKKRVKRFGEGNTLPYSSKEAKIHIDNDIRKMSKHLGKASQQVIKIMMDGVKGGKYDAMDITRGIETGQLNRTHEGERPFMKMLWRKVRDGFRRYSKDKKLRK